jgi:CHAD domain-containing protein
VGFRFKPDESLARATKRIAREQIDKALDELTDRARKTREEAVHDARKRFKRIRALLRLVRTALGKKQYSKENAHFRDAGRLLAGIRDARVLVNTMEELILKYGKQISRGAGAALRKAVQERQQFIAKQLFEEQDALENAVAVLKAARRRRKNWNLDSPCRSTLRAGLKRVYKQGLEAFATATSEPSVENLHEWRKRVKDLWHHLQIIQPLWPRIANDLVKQVHTLADHLGNDHDLAVLRQTLLQEPRRFGGRAALDTVLPLIDSRRGKLQEAARLLGETVYRDKPKIFVNRLCD